MQTLQQRVLKERPRTGFKQCSVKEAQGYIYDRMERKNTDIT